MYRYRGLGAFNVSTNEYVRPEKGNKKDSYNCPDCSKDIIYCQGDVITPYFRHKKDDIPCSYYTSPSESQLHKAGKAILTSMIKEGRAITILRSCCSNKCVNVDDFVIPLMDDDTRVEIEYSFKYNDERKYADVAYLQDDNIIAIFEVFYKHRTKENNRPEPWFELEAIDILTNTMNYTFECKRKIYCDKCLESMTEQIEYERLMREQQLKENKLNQFEDKYRKIYTNNVLCELKRVQELKAKELELKEHKMMLMMKMKRQCVLKELKENLIDFNIVKFKGKGHLFHKRNIKQINKIYKKKYLPTIDMDRVIGVLHNGYCEYKYNYKNINRKFGYAYFKEKILNKYELYHLSELEAECGYTSCVCRGCEHRRN